MTLIPSPPDILLGTTPLPGLSPSAMGDLTINGRKAAQSELVGVLTDATIDFKLDGTSTLSLVINDNHRTFLRSPLAKWLSWVFMDGVGFVYSALQKTGPTLTLVFDHEIVAKLKEFNAPTAVASGTMSRTAFCRQLAASTPWVRVITPGGDSPGSAQSQLAVGNVDPTTGQPTAPAPSTANAPPENYFDAMGRILDEIGWRRFPRGHDQLYLVSDQWLITQPPAYVLDESVPGVDSIDFEWDSLQPVAQCTVTCRAESWAYPPGIVVLLTDKMGIAAGRWLVEEVSRSLLTATCTVTLTQPEPTIPEPAGSGDTSLTTIASDEAANQALVFATQQVGKPYVWGGESTTTGFDCSGLTQAAFASAGISIPRTAQAQFNAGPLASNPIQVGDLVFFGSSPNDIQHVGINVGGGMMVDAPHAGASIRQEPFTAIIGAPWGSEKYQGATRPAANAQPAPTDASTISSGSVPSPSDADAKANQQLGQQMAAAAPYGWTGNQWVALNNVVMAESRWHTDIRNGGSHGPPDNRAYGIPQALPPSKMASAGADWATNAHTQIAWMLNYIKIRYVTPVDAWAYHQQHGSY